MSNDRTLEFLSLARGMGGGASVAAAAPPPRRPDAVSELRGFHQTAAALSKDIAATSHMLGELARLVKRTSLFQDDSQSVNQLVISIKTNIENLNSRLEQASVELQAQKRKLGQNSQASQEASNLVGQLQQEFVQTTCGFKKVLQERTDTLKDQDLQKKSVYGSVQSAPSSYSNVSLENKPIVYDSGSASSASNMTPSFPTLDLTSNYNMSPGEPTSSSHLPRPHGARGDGGGGGSFMTPTMRSDSLPTYSGGTSSMYGGGSSSISRAPLTPYDIAVAERESGRDQMMQLIPDQDYLRERADAMEMVEGNIVELGKVFHKLAHLVHEHGDMVRRVEDNVDEADAHISLSMETLTDTLTHLRTNKALFLKVFAVLVIFIILFITFFA